MATTSKEPTRATASPRLPAPYEEPDPSQWIDPFADPALGRYYEQVNEWLGYVRFVGLPRLKENPDVPIEGLFVQPAMARQHLSADRPEEEWQDETTPALDVLAEHPRLVLLGDPGSGKSTLAAWVAWRLTRPETDDFSENIGRRVPLPMILRELELDERLTWKRLLRRFLAHPMASPLGSAPRVEELLAHGQGFVILDGIDEIGSIAVREALRRAVWEGWETHPGCRWLLTSRVIGYDALPFERWTVLDLESSLALGGKVTPLESQDSSEIGIELVAARLKEAANMGVSRLRLRYLSPFTDEQIRLFAHNWYAQREPSRDLRAEGAKNLVDSVLANANTHRLARIPNLLAMMALIHRIRARLPYGRALLYNEIAQAYLETIDEFRGFRGLGYTLDDKKRWLAFVGYKMQRRRSRQGEDEAAEGADRILAGESEVLGWMAEAMAETGARSEEAARSFLDYVARRSGLLLPRAPGPEGEQRFAFTHLSFQEYFAAVYLASQVKQPRWIFGKASGPGPSLKDLQGFAREAPWRETLILLFELLAAERGWPQELAAQLFGEGFERVEGGRKEDQPLALLAAELAVDPHSGFDEGLRRRAVAAGVGWEVARQAALASLERSIYQPEVLRVLLAGEGPNVLEVLAASAQQAEGLSLSGTGVADLAPLQDLTQLQWLDLSGTRVVDLAPLRKLTQLRELYLHDTRVADLAPVQGLTQLRGLFLGGTRVVDLAPLQNLTQLAVLNLSGTRVADLAPLDDLPRLQILRLNATTPLPGAVERLREKRPKLKIR